MRESIPPRTSSGNTPFLGSEKKQLYLVVSTIFQNTPLPYVQSAMRDPSLTYNFIIRAKTESFPSRWHDRMRLFVAAPPLNRLDFFGFSPFVSSGLRPYGLLDLSGIGVDFDLWYTKLKDKVNKFSCFTSIDGFMGSHFPGKIPVIVQ